MDTDNLYLPPVCESLSRRESRALTRFRTAGIALGAIIGSLYAFIFGASMYEFARSTPTQSITDYVRTAIVSVAFAILSFTATICYLKRLRIGRWLLLLSPTLLIVFIFPGLNTVWNFVGRMFRF